MLTYVSIGAFAGVVVLGLLSVVLGLKGGPWRLPWVGMMVCFLGLIVSVILPNFLGGEKDPGTADEPSGAVESQRVDESEGPEESNMPPDKSVAPSVAPTKVPELEKTQSEAPESNVPYVVTYENSKIYKNSLGEIDCYVLVEIENTGKDDLYLKDATFDFEGKDGSLLGTCSGIISSDPDIIAPGEKGYFYCNGGSVQGNITEKTEYVFKSNLKVEKSKKDIIRFDISDLSISEGRYGPVSIIGRIANNTNEDEGLVWIACVLYRGDGTPIGVYGTNITDFGAGQTTSFDADAIYLGDLDIKLSDVADYKVYACKTQYQF